MLVSAPRGERLCLTVALVCLAMSGAVGLVYEVVWTRAVTVLFGSVVPATGALLAVFMGGLAVGAAVGGRLAARLRRPLAVFGGAEILIGVLALASPYLLRVLEPVVFRFQDALPGAVTPLVATLFCALALGPVVVLMGVTFPLFVAHVAADRRRLGCDTGLVYGINTLGAVLGTLAAGFLLIPALGIVNGLRVTATVDVVAGGVCLVLGLLVAPVDRDRAEAEPAAALPRRRDRSLRLAVVVAFLGGSASLMLEVVWFRGMMLIVGSSVYALSLMLAAFLTGLGVGGLWLARRADRAVEPQRVVGSFHVLIAFSATIVTVVLQLLPGPFIWLLEASGGAFASLMIGTSVLLVALLLVPTVLMGAALPAAIRLADEGAGEHSVPALAGRVYASSSIGSGLGALVAGLVLLPALGLRWAAAVAVVVSLVAGVSCLVGARPGRQRRVNLQAAAVTAGIWIVWALGLLPWSWQVMTAGYYAYAHLYSGNQVQARGPVRRQVYLDREHPFGTVEHTAPPPGTVGDGAERLLFWQEGHFSQVAVVEAGGTRSLLVNGKTDASNGPQDMRTQLLLAHLPVLMAPQPPAGRAMVIGLGSGITAGAVASYPFDEVIAVELEPAVVRAAERFFVRENHDVLNNDRVRLVVDDARHVLVRETGELALLTSEPSNLWMSGVSLLFTREFFALAAERLGDDGVLCQWLHLYQVGHDDVRTLLATLGLSFHHMIAVADGSDLLIVASQAPLSLEPNEWQQRLHSSRWSADLIRVGVTSASLLASEIVADETAINRWSRGAILHTDDRPILEFTAARWMASDLSGPILASLVRSGVEAGPIQLGTAGAVVGPARSGPRNTAHPPG